jgi:transaldolase
MEVVGDIVRIFQNYDFSTQVLVASVRSPIHLLEAASMGADVATVPFQVIAQLLRHPLTDIGLEKFLADYRRASQMR